MIILIVLILLLILYAWLIRSNLPRRELGALAGIHYAHRGLWNQDRPENSLAAFAAAVDAGYGIELDVHLTKDGHLVVHHDNSLQRICGEDVQIEQNDLARIRQARLGKTDETVPTFDEVLALVNGQVPLIVELKVSGKNSDALAKAVYERMQRYEGVWCVESFDPMPIRWFRENAPEIIRGQLAYDEPCKAKSAGDFFLRLVIATLLQNFFSRPDFVAFKAQTESWHTLSMKLMRLMRPHLVAWTIRSQEAMDRCRGRYDLVIFEGFVPES